MEGLLHMTEIGGSIQIDYDKEMVRIDMRSTICSRREEETETFCPRTKMVPSTSLRLPPFQTEMTRKERI